MVVPFCDDAKKHLDYNGTNAYYGLTCIDSRLWIGLVQIGCSLMAGLLIQQPVIDVIIFKTYTIVLTATTTWPDMCNTWAWRT
jgi:hypothetical protein